jgi:hypothetical protein
MVLATASLYSYSKQTNQDVNRDVALGNSLVPLIYVAYIVDIALMVLAYYYYFKCNFAKGVVSSGSDKVLGFLGACCCNLLYVIYHVVVPC